VSLRKRLILGLMSLYPPFVGAGVRVRLVSRSPYVFETRMKLHAWNRNYLGTHYGGSLYTMCDPFFLLILIEALGPEFVVWDKAATIRFLRPGRGTVHARFAIPAAEIERIRRETAAEGRARPQFVTRVVDENGEVVAEVEKLLSVRLRRRPGLGAPTG